MPDMFQDSLSRLLVDAPLVGLLLFALYKVWRRLDEMLEKRYNEQAVAFRETTSALIAFSEARKGYEANMREAMGVVLRLETSAQLNENGINGMKEALSELTSEIRNMRTRMDAVNVSVEQFKTLCTVVRPWAPQE